MTSSLRVLFRYFSVHSKLLSRVLNSVKVNVSLVWVTCTENGASLSVSFALINITFLALSTWMYRFSSSRHQLSYLLYVSCCLLPHSFEFCFLCCSSKIMHKFNLVFSESYPLQLFLSFVS
uniref:Uncharacterized protein n=1 Tax=Oryzias latipes TaxID=8090 RepID=A0A3P9IJE3_ORYLA